jgi:hypothetical protein
MNSHDKPNKENRFECGLSRIYKITSSMLLKKPQQKFFSSRTRRRVAYHFINRRRKTNKQTHKHTETQNTHHSTENKQTQTLDKLIGTDQRATGKDLIDQLT